MILRLGFAALVISLSLMSAAVVCWLYERQVHIRIWKKVKSLSPLSRAVALAAVILATWFGGAKPDGSGSSDPSGGDSPGLQMSGLHGGTVLLTQGDEDQPGVVTNQLSVVRFGVDNDAHELDFGFAWTDGFWNFLGGNRTIDIFMSTNLLHCWTRILDLSMPPFTNACDFIVGRYDVDNDYREWFEKSFAGKAFFRFGTRLDSDGDFLTDAEEEFVYGTSPLRVDTDFDGLSDYDECGYCGTDPCDPDSDGDGVWDGDERYQSSDPLLVDSDADGLSDAEEADSCHSYKLPLWFEGDGQSVVLNAQSENVREVVWNLTLSNAVSLAGRAYSNLVVDVNGVLYLSQSVIGATSDNHPQYMWNTGWNRGEIAIAPFWSDLVLRPSQNASVSLKTNANGDSIVEFLNAGFNDPNYADRTVSFQVVFSPSATNRVIIAYKGVDLTVVNYVSPMPRSGFRVDNGLYADGRYEQLHVDAGDSYHILRYGYGTDCFDSDSDGDLLSDYDELFVYHTDPMCWTDRDNDGLSDGEERFVYRTDPDLADTDGDGVEDGDEVWDGFDPLVDESELDTDGDGVLDFDEAYDYHTDRFDADTDGDGLDDFEEIFVSETDPCCSDTDGDGLSDYDEVVIYGTNPVGDDTDGDGLPDDWEIAYGLDPLSYEGDDGASGDPDGDGVINVREYGFGSNPDAVDSDGDGLRDDEEVGSFERFFGSAVAFDCSGGVNLLPSSSDDFDDDRFNFPLPFPVTVAGVTATNMVVSVNGVVGLISTNFQNQSWGPSYGNCDLAACIVNSYHATIAACWDDLKAYAAQGASIRVADVGVGDERCCVIEYRNVGIRSGGYSAANSATFQIVIPSVITNGISVQYLRMDGAFDGSGATVGMQVSDRTSIPVSFNSLGCPLAGDRIVFQVGIGTNPANPDTDDDGLVDGDEANVGTSPFQKDTDGDGLPDGWEVQYGFNPRVAADADGDADNDGVSNLEECRHGSNPHSADTDGDGLSDGAEVELGTDLTNSDTDNDGLDDSYEYDAGLDPCHPDTDRDGLPDGWEVDHGLDPDCATGDDGTNGDPDHDGLSNIDEYQNGCDPKEPDTDRDRVSDGVEVGQGSDPTDASDHGIAPPSDKFRELVFNIDGDYAAWEMTIEGLGPDDTRTRKITMGAPNAAQNVPLKMRKGNSYRLSMRWLNCDGHHDSLSPWYCWQALIDGLPSQCSFDHNYREGYCVRIPQLNNIVFGNGWIAENEGGLLTSHVHSSQKNYDGGSGAGNVAGGLVARLYVLDDPALVPDYDGNGEIDDADGTLAGSGKVFRFWINDDKDAASSDGDLARNSKILDSGNDDIPASGNDGSDGKVNGRRDLVDFTPIHLDVSACLGVLPASLRERMTFRLRQRDGALNAVWSNLSPSGASSFQTAQYSSGFGRAFDAVPQNARAEQITSNGLELPARFAGKVTDGDGVFLIEGRSETTAPLVVEALYDGNTVCTGRLDVSIKPVERMYRWLGLRWVCGQSDLSEMSTAEPENLPDDETSGPHFVFVHGYNVNVQSARGWAAEMFKRLWQAGARSKFTAVDWYGDESQLWAGVPVAGGESLDYYVNVRHALDTAQHLQTMLPGASDERVVLAHSLGNMLVSEAATYYGLVYSKYYMLNAAVPMEAYDAVALNEEMYEHGWTDVPPAKWAANWHERIPYANDPRRSLKWKGHFAGIRNAVNCYSPTEDVLGNATVNGYGGIWSVQELYKGTAALHFVPGNCEGGWGYNDDHTNILGLLKDSAKTQPFTDAELIASPIFRKFDNDLLHQTNRITIAQTELNKVLGDGIPAISFAAGRNMTGGVADNYNYNSYMANVESWPRFSRENGVKQLLWHHSDIKNIAYYFVYPFFEQLVSEGD